MIVTDQSDPFNKEVKVEETPPQDSPSEDSLVDRLKDIKNERGEPKYDSIEKALEALQHSQEYIPDLKGRLTTYEQELETLRAELATRQSVEDVVSRLTASQDQDLPGDQGTPPEVRGLDEQATKKLFEDWLYEKQQKQTFESNRQKVNSALFDLYGEKVSEVVAEKAKALGTTPNQLGDLANQNPQLVLALFNTQTKQGHSPTTSSNNIPYSGNSHPELERPTKSLLSGATAKEQADYMKRIKEDVYRKYGVKP